MMSKEAARYILASAIETFVKKMFWGPSHLPRVIDYTLSLLLGLPPLRTRIR